MYNIHGIMPVGHLNFECPVRGVIPVTLWFRSTGKHRKGKHMEFLVTTSPTVSYTNKELQRATSTIFKIGDAIRKNWFAIAHVIARVDKMECYKDDGFSTVHEWTEKTFGIKKTASYSLLTIGKEYTREIVNASGKVIGYGSNLISDGSDDFSKTQVEKMLPVGHEKAVTLVTDGEITPEMSAKEISRIIKSYTNSESEQENTGDGEPEQEIDADSKGETVSVWDKDGSEYMIPVAILEKYAI